MKWRFQIFWKEALLFLAVQAIGLYIAHLLLPKLANLAPVEISIWVFLFYIIGAFIIFFVAAKLFRGPVFFQLFFALLIFIGANIVFDTLGLGENAALLAVTVVVLRVIHPTIWTQNLAIVLSLAGIGAAFGVGLSVTAGIILLIGLSIYDVFAVYQTNYLVKVFSKLVERGVFLSIIVPEKIEDWGSHLGKLKVGPGSGIVILGTGDLVLPLIFASAALSQSVWLSIGSIIGGAFGLLGVHAWLMALKQQRALPALPPIALGIFVGYALTWAILASQALL